MDSRQSPSLLYHLDGNLTEHAENMSCVTLEEELRDICFNDSMANTPMCNRSAQGINLAVPITMTAFGVCGNILALLVLYSSRKEQAQARRTVFFVMLSGLAWTEIMCQVAVSPIAIVTYVNKLRWVGGTPLCHYHGFMMVSFGMVMPLIICCMSLERLLAIKFSYCYTRRVTRRKALLTFLACWGVTLAFTALPFVGFGSYRRQYPGSWCFLDFHRTSLADTIYAGVFSSINILAILTMIVSNLTVAGILCRLRFSRQLSNSPALDRKLSLSGQFTPSSTTCAPGTVIRMKRHSDMEAQMIWFLGLITVAFSVCWLPLNVHILVMQFTGKIDCVLDLKVIRMASCNQILDPWLYVIFRKNSILRIVRRIQACFRPKKELARAQNLQRMKYMTYNRSFTVDGTTYVRNGFIGGRANHPRVCKHLILAGADLIGESKWEKNSAKTGVDGLTADLLCSECSLCEDGDSSQCDGYDPLINLRLGSSPTNMDAVENSGIDRFSPSDSNEGSTCETDLRSDGRKSDAVLEKQETIDKKAKSTKSPVPSLKTAVTPVLAKEKLRWFLPGTNSSGGDAFASYESTETFNFPPMRAPSLKSPHPIYKQKVHPSRSLLDNMTPGFSPADFQEESSIQAAPSTFIFPPLAAECNDHVVQDLKVATDDASITPETSTEDNDFSTATEGADSPLLYNGLIKENHTTDPNSNTCVREQTSPACLSLSSSREVSTSSLKGSIKGSDEDQQPISPTGYEPPDGKTKYFPFYPKSSLRLQGSLSGQGKPGQLISKTDYPSSMNNSIHHQQEESRFHASPAESPSGQNSSKRQVPILSTHSKQSNDEWVRYTGDSTCSNQNGAEISNGPALHSAGMSRKSDTGTHVRDRKDRNVETRFCNSPEAATVIWSKPEKFGEDSATTDGRVHPSINGFGKRH